MVMALDFIYRKYLFDYDNGTEKKLWSIDASPFGFTVQHGDGEAQQQKFDNELDCQNEAIRLMNEKRSEGYVEVRNDINRPGSYYDFTDHISQKASWYSAEAAIAILRLVQNMMGFTEEEKKVLFTYFRNVKELYIDLRHVEVAIMLRSDSKLECIMDCRIMLSEEKVVVDYFTLDAEPVYIEKAFTPAFKEAFAEFLKKYEKGSWVDKEQAEKAAVERQEKDTVRRKKLIPLFQKNLISYPHTYLPNKLENAIIKLYGGTRRDPAPYSEMLDNELILLLECARDMPKKKVDYETLLTNFYRTLNDLCRPLSLKRVKALLHQVMNEGVIPDPIRFYLGDNDFAPWEKELVGMEEKMDPEKLEQVKPLVERVVNSIDDYLLAWRFTHVRIYIKERVGAVEERGLFRAAGKHPQLEPLVAQYVNKLIEAIRVYPLYEDYGSSTAIWRGYIGASAVAALASFNPPKYDDTLLTYLDILEKVAGDFFDELLSDIYCSWEKGKVPALPKTFAKYPALQSRR